MMKNRRRLAVRLLVSCFCLVAWAGCGGASNGDMSVDGGTHADATDAAIGGDVLTDVPTPPGDAVDGPDVEVPDDVPSLPDGTDGGPGPDTDAGGGPVDPPFTVVTCGALDAPAEGTCDVDEGSAHLLLRGTVLTPDEVLVGGEVLVAPGGCILCAACDCSDAPGAAEATVITCADGVISPGLVNAHDHLSFTHNDPGHWGDERYEHRHNWRCGTGSHTEINAAGGASDLHKAWGELRQVMSGTTSLAGSGHANGFLRNLDRGLLQREGVGPVSVDYQTFPLGDSDCTMRDSGCDYPHVPYADALDADCYLPHVAEGINAAARNEFLCLSDDAGGGTDVTAPNSAFIHCVGLLAEDGAEMAVEGAAVVWSPRSNISLYGNTAPVTMFHAQGVLIALGTDWTPSGSINMQRELACASLLNDLHYGGYFSDRDLWWMATAGGAMALAVDDEIGAIRQGLKADLVVYAGYDPEAPFAAVVDSNVDDTVLVLRGGVPLYGDAAVLLDLPGGQTGCEAIPDGVCGLDKAVCAERELGVSFADLAAANASAYDLFFCGVPDGEPSCVPVRPGEYDGADTAGDQDGDGIPDGEDNCQAVFNPVRPIDDGSQGDADGDGVGDACDPCPLEANATSCTKPNPDDEDGDGTSTMRDNCPVVPNPGQEDRDGDGVGDACDPCPDSANPCGGACPVTIYEVKQEGPRLQGNVVVVEGVVTAVSAPRFFVQVPEDAQDPALGARFSGAYVYVPSENPSGTVVPNVGDLIRMTAEVAEFFGQWQLSFATDVQILATDTAVPAPVVVETSAVCTGCDDADDYEGVLVHVESCEVTAVQPAAGPGDGDPTNEFVCNDELKVNDLVYRMDPFPEVGDVFALTGVLRYANDDSKLEIRGPDDVSWVASVPPRLIAIEPALAYVDEGTTDVVSIPELRVVLHRPAPEGGTSVDLTSGSARLVVPRGVTVPEGETSVAVPLTGVTGSDEPVTVTASLDDASFDAQVIVVAPERVPAPVAIEPAAALIVSGTSFDFTVTLDIPALAGGTDLTLTADEAVLDPPAGHIMPAGALTTTITVVAVAAGETELVVSTAAGEVRASVEVTDVPPLGLVLSEALYDTAGEDSGKEWVELFNGTAQAIDLSGYSLGNAGSDYLDSLHQLSGIVPPGGCFVVGGPLSIDDNANPTYDLVLDFSPDLQNSGSAADAIALFDRPAGEVTAGTVPIDAVIYGSPNTAGLIDESGTAPSITDVGDADRNESIERRLDGWIIQAVPSPGDCSPVYLP